jgi:hypothetical protein
LDGIDTNCSGDETDAVDATTWYADTDGDTYGDANNSTDGLLTASRLCSEQHGLRRY